ncbi:hypothetical protein MACH09_46220 [Vibrio sp. MACH09]|uniref:hypothetical protein n=1 Tax=Vibrio sp. MACH09 TaxID=3025122 RepID=UPI0027950176|nr:hypothetical protein [Vibrio sp. MACH09]GLO64114.1 hypothetical protein MACH09_46220 [Vibrio sp. MACH09]
MKIKIILTVAAIASTVVFLANDYRRYMSNIDSTSCCGYVAPEWYKRPLTHLLVRWSEPEWRLNGNNSELWFVSDGLVDGKVQFWTVWESRPNLMNHGY